MIYIPMADRNLQFNLSALYLAMSVFSTGEPALSDMNTFSRFVDVLIHGKQFHIPSNWVMKAKEIKDKTWSKFLDDNARMVVPVDANILFFHIQILHEMPLRHTEIDAVTTPSCTDHPKKPIEMFTDRKVSDANLEMTFTPNDNALRKGEEGGGDAAGHTNYCNRMVEKEILYSDQEEILMAQALFHTFTN